MNKWITQIASKYAYLGDKYIYSSPSIRSDHHQFYNIDNNKIGNWRIGSGDGCLENGRGVVRPESYLNDKSFTAFGYNLYSVWCTTIDNNEAELQFMETDFRLDNINKNYKKIPSKEIYSLIFESGVESIHSSGEYASSPNFLRWIGYSPIVMNYKGGVLVLGCFNSAPSFTEGEFTQSSGMIPMDIKSVQFSDTRFIDLGSGFYGHNYKNYDNLVDPDTFQDHFFYQSYWYSPPIGEQSGVFIINNSGLPIEVRGAGYSGTSFWENTRRDLYADAIQPTGGGLNWHTDFYDAFENVLGMTDAIEYKDSIICANSIDVVSLNGDDLNRWERIHTSTTNNYYATSPKWFAVYDSNLYMYEGDGWLSQINYSNGNFDRSTVYDLSYIPEVNGDNCAYGNMRSREDGRERAVKSAIIAFNDYLHIFIGGENRIYHVKTDNPSSATYHTNLSDDLPDIMKNHTGNITVRKDPDSGNLILLFTIMGKDQTLGLLGWITHGNSVGGTRYLFEYDGSTWTEIGWYPFGTVAGGGLMAYNIDGANAACSGAYDNGFSVTPDCYICNDYVLLDYTIIDRYSRNWDAYIKYSLDYGETWSTCRRQKDRIYRNYLGDPTIDISGSPSGEKYTFYWDYVTDVGYTTSDRDIKLKVTLTPHE